MGKKHSKVIKTSSLLTCPYCAGNHKNVDCPELKSAANQALMLDNSKFTCIDLFCGKGGWSKAFKDRGWNVITQDWDPKFNPDICKDIMDVQVSDFPKNPEIILASPPCNCFSVNTIGMYWNKGKPNEKAMIALGYVGKTLWLIGSISPKFWIVENPRGMLIHFLGKPDVVTYFAAWGNENLKPTNLWGRIPPMEWPKPFNWTKSPRGTQLGTRSMKSEDAAMIPYPMSLAVCIATENSLRRAGPSNSLEKFGLEGFR